MFFRVLRGKSIRTSWLVVGPIEVVLDRIFQRLMIMIGLSDAKAQRRKVQHVRLCELCTFARGIFTWVSRSVWEHAAYCMKRSPISKVSNVKTPAMTLTGPGHSPGGKSLTSLRNLAGNQRLMAASSEPVNVLINYLALKLCLVGMATD